MVLAQAHGLRLRDPTWRGAAPCSELPLLGSPLSRRCQGTARYSPAGVGSAGTAFLTPPTENISPQAAALQGDSEALAGDVTKVVVRVTKQADQVSGPHS